MVGGRRGQGPRRGPQWFSWASRSTGTEGHNRWHTPLPGGLDPETIGTITTELTARAELMQRYTGHSPRRAGNDRKVIAKQGGWVENSAAMEGYFEAGEGWEENAMIGVL
ncbi:hypothetical protein [Streptomyces albogriseolus]|uniref:hypothetical protein n=1 Tax=Streptomyces albogriseolus TaxID=1887 RepID=UPI0034612343